MKKRAIAIFLAVFSLALPVLSAEPSFAQSSPSASPAQESITLSPTSRKYQVDAGKTITDELTVVNDGQLPYDFLVYARPYSIVNNEYDNPSFTSGPKNADLYGWVRFDKTRYHIEAGATVKVPYSVQVPATAAPGGHYGVIFAETQPVQGDPSSNAVIRKKRVGMIMYTTVNGKYIDSAEDKGVSVPFWQTQPPLQATAAVNNTGNNDFYDTVTMRVSNVLGKVMYQSTKPYAVLPSTTRTVPLSWTNAPWFGLYKVHIQQKFLDKTTESDKYVLMMPRLVPFVIVLLLVIGAIYAWVLRKRKK